MSTTYPENHPLHGMTQAKWSRLTPPERNAIRDLSELTPDLIGKEGARVEVVTTYDETRRFWVGRSSGWRPCHIEIHNTRALGGPSAEPSYKSVRVVRRGAFGGAHPSRYR